MPHARGGMSMLIPATCTQLPSSGGLVVPDQLVELCNGHTTSASGNHPESRNMQTVIHTRTRKDLL